MAQASNILLDLAQALQLVRAAGYRVTKPKPRKLTSRGPELADMFGRNNGQFKRDRFMHACEPGANVRARNGGRSNG